MPELPDDLGQQQVERGIEKIVGSRHALRELDLLRRLGADRRRLHRSLNERRLIIVIATNPRGEAEEDETLACR